MHRFIFYLLCCLLDERGEISHLRSSLCVKMTFHWPVHQRKFLPLTRTLQSYLLFPWYWRRPSSGHSCSDSSSILPTLPMTVNISGLKYILVAVEVNYRFFLKIKMNHLVQPKILGQAILQRDRSSRGKSCLEQGKNFAFELELQNSNFQKFNLRNLLSCTVSTFKFQTSCLIKSATVVCSFPFWPNSGQYSTILIQRRTN